MYNQIVNADNIKLSFLVPVYNGIQYTKEFLSSFNDTMKDKNYPYEMLIGDNGSIDGSRDFLKTLANDKVKVFLNEQDLYYGGNMNNLAKHAKGKFLILMNNDLVLTPNWLEPMLNIFNQRNDIGIVGNIQIIPKLEVMDHMGVVFDKNGLPYHITSKQLPNEEYTQWNAVTGACIVMQRETFLKLGGYDEVFKNGYEDTDLCLRVKQVGLKIYTANKSVIYHHTSKSGVRGRYTSENSNHFSKKWEEVGKSFHHKERPICKRNRAENYLRQCKEDLKWWDINIIKLLKSYFRVRRAKYIELNSAQSKSNILHH